MKNLNYNLFLLALIFTFNLFAQEKENVTKQSAPGIPVVHIPKSSGKYLGTPSIIRLQNGHYLIAHDFFGPACKEDIVHVYLSKNKGKTWTFQSEIKDAFWAGLFAIENEVYFLGVQGSTRNLAIWKSCNNGSTWSLPSILKDGRFHGSSTPVIFHNNRIYKGYDNLGIEDKKKKWMADNKSFVMSAPVSSNLMNPASWTYSDEIKKPENMDGTGWLETNAVLGLDGNIKGITRVANESGYIAGCYSLKNDSVVDLTSIRTINFPGGATKFNILWDKRTKKYWSLTNYPSEVQREPKMRAGGMRSVLALTYSDDLINWNLKAIILASDDVKLDGFQYVDWQFEGKDIIFLSRTAFDDSLGGPANFHDSNYITFHRIKNYAKAQTPKQYKHFINN